MMDERLMVRVEERTMFNHSGARFLDLIRLMGYHPTLAGGLLRDASSRKTMPVSGSRGDAANGQYDSAEYLPHPSQYLPRC